MRKFFQIIGITIGSIVGLMVVVAAIAIWCIFTPERVTPVARNLADTYITCEWDIGDVELTFFSTFPEFGLKVNGLYLVNPLPEAPSDTVLTASQVVARLNVMAYLQHNNLVVRELSLKDLTANIYIDHQGICNANVFDVPSDTVAKDTTAFNLPFDSIVVHGCAIEANRLTFVDQKDGMDIRLGSTDLRLRMAYWDDLRLQVQSKVENLLIKDEPYAHDLTLSLDLPAEVDLETMHMVLHKGEVAVNEFDLRLDGEVTLGDSIPMNLRLTTGTWSIQPLLALLPKSLQQSLDSIEADGRFSIDATAQGVYQEGRMPLVDANLRLKQGQVRYAALPYTFERIDLDASAHLDMNVPEHSQVTISTLSASSLNSHFRLKGSIRDVLGQMRTQAHVELDAMIPDWAYFLPKTMQIDGHVKGSMDLTASLTDVVAQRLNSLNAQGQLDLEDLALQTDSLAAQLTQATVAVDATLKDWPVVYADVALQSSETAHMAADSLDVQLTAAKLKAKASINIQDTTSIPTVEASVQWQDLQGYFKNYKGHIGYSQLDAKMTNAGRNRKLPVFKGNLTSHNIDAYAAGNHVVTKSIDLEAKSLYNEKGTNFLLTWNPLMRFSLNGAEVDLTNFEEHISIPQIIFNYSNRDFTIISSSVILGQSDFSLTGDIHKIGKWLLKKDVLSGELNFVSNHTDVNELLRLFSADAGSEETKTKTTTTTDSTAEPFLVPKDVDLTLTTQIKEAKVLNQVAKNLRGKVYVRDGMLVLEEMGFVCDAAKLQLTAIYRTPRRDHIYIGLDYHMLDVKIDQLISMIPQIDSMVPMLRSFKGEAEFHLAAETYLRENYSIKTSTLRGACSLFGKNLVVMDSETFDKISKVLSFKKKTENKVDSISAEITLYKDEVDVYPFCVSIDNYTAALGGQHHLDMSFDYHINLLSPIYLGVDIKGTPDNLSIKPAKCIYAKDFKPNVHHQVDTQNAELRKIIRTSLRKNVHIE